MAVEAEIAERAARPYLGITESVSMAELGPKGGDLSGELFGWLAEHGVEPLGPLAWKYNLIDMDNQIELEVCVPLAEPVEGAGRVHAGVLPAGRYAEYLHVGHPDDLLGATRDLLDWADRSGHAWAMDGERWAARLEEYLSDPVDQPDMTTWETRLAFLLAD